MSNTEAEFDKLASELYKTLGINSGERLKSAARSGSWRRREEHSSSMKVKQDWATESRRRVSSEVASPPSVSSPPNDLAAYTFTKPNISPKKTVGNCGSCNRSISTMEEACTALDKVFHVACFTCTECNCTLLGKTFYEVKGRAFCAKDYEAMLQVCHVCDRPVKEKVLKAVGKVFHPSCFTCTKCHKCLQGIPFTVDSLGQVYCIDDFHKRYAPKCGICQLPIMPEKGSSETIRIISMDKSFHPECYKCEDCGIRLAKKGDEGRKCYPLDDHLLCRLCNTARIRTLTKANSIDFDFTLRSRTTVT